MRYKEWCAIRPRTDRQKRAYMKKIVKQNLVGTSMVILPFLGFLCFTLFPMLLSLALAFSNLRSALISEAKFDAGFKNFIFILKDEYTWKAMRTTLVYSLTTFLNVAVALFLARVMNRHIYGKKFYLVLFFLPQVCSSVAVAMMWRWVFAETGVINAFRVVQGKPVIDFFTDERYYMLAIYVMSLWKRGTNIVILLSAFSAINQSLEEAARLDGANERQVFWNVTFPQLTPTIFYLITMNLIASFQEQALFQLLNPSAAPTGPNFWGLTLTYQMYRLMNVNLQYGLACAMSWFIGIFILIVTRLNFWFGKKWVSYD